jgi:hypothetical protein
MHHLPSVALLSARLKPTLNGVNHPIAQPSVYPRADYSSLLWSLWRLGVRQVIAQPHDLTALRAAAHWLNPPPVTPAYQAPLLIELIEMHQRQLRDEPLSLLAWSQDLELSELPSQPVNLAGIQLCFHDELIGVDDALLIHYGPSQFEVSGYHPPISSLSVPLSDELSALVLFRVTPDQHDAPRRRSQSSEAYLPVKGDEHKGDHLPDTSPTYTSPTYTSPASSLETGVIHISARGELIKGPWWPRLS